MGKSGMGRSLRTIIKKWQHLNPHTSNSRASHKKQPPHTTQTKAAATTTTTTTTTTSSSSLHTVYVGKSRRRYLVEPHLLGHPLLRGLVEEEEVEGDAVVSRCEVVLFEHLLWMLENNSDHLPGSLDELHDYYCMC